MGFVGVSRAVYDFQPTGEGELEIKEGDLLFILEKSSGDDWWKAKKKAADDEEDEPEGLVPNNYVEQAEPIGSAKALYDYSRQTDEEISFSEEAVLHVYDSSDPDWTLVGLDDEYGFAPANYLELNQDAAPAKPPRPPAATSTQPDEQYEEDQSAAATNPAAALAGIIQQKTGSSAAPIAPQTARQMILEPSDDDEPPPSLPQRPSSQQMPSPARSGYASPRSPEPPGIITSRARSVSNSGDQIMSPSGYRLYNIHEMISHMGKNKKMPTTLGVSVAKGIITISPEKSRDGPQQEWSAEKLTHYSIEGKHVFLELIRPSKSIDFHAGAKDTAEEIVRALGELAGLARGGGMREIMNAANGVSGQKKGHMLFEFMAQGEDEVTVAENDQVIILDDSQSDEWWMIRRLKNGKEGVVPANYVEVTGVTEAAEDPSIAAAKETAEQYRRDEVAAQRAREARPSERKDSRRKSRANGGSSDSKPKPNLDKVRTWTDRSKSFKVDAEFLGLKDGKIHLHKMNGVQIAVPVAKMSVPDLEYVERVTGHSLDEEKPLSDIKRRQSVGGSQADARAGRSGAAVEPKRPKYDWFDFFLACGVNPQICERYASSFDRDQMSEENLPDVQPTLLRTLGLKEGDILRVMKYLDEKYGRHRKTDETDGVNGGGQGIFTGPDGGLKNNTRKGRPAPPVSSNDTVDPRAFEQNALKQDSRQSSAPPTPSAVVSSGPKEPEQARKQRSGFDDDAWNIRPASKPTPVQSSVSPPPTQSIAAPAPQKPTPTGAMAELSLLSAPLQPTPAPPMPPPMQQQAPTSPAQAQQPPQQPSGADRALFDKIAQVQAQAPPRQRPQPPPQQGSSFLPLPPGRAASAPQNQQPFSAPPPLQQQMTGYASAAMAGGPSLNDLNQQQQMQQSQMYMGNMQMPQQTGMMYNPGMNPNMSMQPPMNGLYPPQGQPSLMNGQQQSGSPFADPPRAPFQPQPTGFAPQPTGFAPQPTGFPQQQPSFQSAPPQLAQPTGVNTFLQPALQPQKTGAGFGGFGPQPAGFAQPSLQPQATGFGQAPQQMQVPPVPAIPQSTPAPLQAQRTGPAPPVRFGVGNTNKLMPQPTGRANLANATPDNPFGF